MKKDVHDARQQVQDYMVEVDVSSDRLNAISPNSVSSMTINAGIRNYEWSQVEQKEGEPIRRLVPE